MKRSLESTFGSGRSLFLARSAKDRASTCLSLRHQRHPVWDLANL